MQRGLSALLFLALASTPARAGEASHLAEARRAFLDADFEAALRSLSLAERGAKDPGALALVHVQRGIVEEALGRRDAALMSFARANHTDAAVVFDAAHQKPSTVALFECARRSAAAGESMAQIQRRATFDGVDAACATAPPMPPARIEVTAAPTSAAETAWRWSMIAGGVAVFGAGLGLDLGLDAGQDYEFQATDLLGLGLMVVGVVAVIVGAAYNPYAVDGPPSVPGSAAQPRSLLSF